MARIAIDARKLGDFGIGSYLEVLLRGLAREGGEHEYLVFVDAHRRASWPAAPFELVPCRSGQYGLLEHLELPLAARRHGADLLHAPHYVLPLARRAPSVVTIHDLIHLRFPAALPNRAAGLYARAMLRSAWRRASCVLTVSEFTRADLEREFGARAEVFVVPNSVDALFFEPVGTEEVEARLLGLGLEPEGERRPFVFLPGNVKPHKNHPGLLRALARLAPELEVELVLAGNAAPQYASLRAEAERLGIARRVHWLGWLDPLELRACYRACALLAFPSLYEGFGLPVAEALVCGAPVVASNRSSLPEVCGDAALLVDPDDEPALAAALTRVLTEPALREDLRQRASVAARRFSPELQSRATLRVYERALSL